MEAVLIFNLPDDQSDFEHAVNGTKAHVALWEMDQYLRSEIKHMGKNLDDVRNKLWEIINEYNLKIDD